MRKNSFWRNDQNNLKVKKVVLIFILAFGIVTSFSLIWSSFKQIDWNEYGLKQNIITKQIDNNIYEEGLYFIGFWNDFIIFPSIYITIEFTPSASADDIPISVQTKNGLLVYI
ncbi:MAG: hypothetical protein ACFE9S_16790, partial [Candidatus Hermodarchaeota archaeon]